MTTLQNEFLSVVIAPKGAELQSIQHNQTKLEYLWQGDPAFWGKRSPILFPIVGGLKQNRYQHNGKTYEMGRHGFARDKMFTLTAQTEHTVTFSLTHDEESLRIYPFEFAFHVRYSLEENRLTCTYSVTNTGTETMYFSVGAHPAFNLPLVAGTTFDQYNLQFNQTEHCGIFPLSAEGLIEENAIPYIQNTNKLPLEKSLFYTDALVFKSLQSTAIAIKTDASPHGLEVAFSGFPYMGIWSAKEADFVCIEPWCGIADSVTANGNLSEKEGIIRLAITEEWESSWTVTLF
jgi:galactose mutarotase-like enzyme